MLENGKKTHELHLVKALVELLVDQYLPSSFCASKGGPSRFLENTTMLPTKAISTRRTLRCCHPATLFCIAHDKLTSPTMRSSSGVAGCPPGCRALLPLRHGYNFDTCITNIKKKIENNVVPADVEQVPR